MIWILCALLSVIAVLLWLCLAQLSALNVRTQDLVENTCTLISQLQQR